MASTRKLTLEDFKKNCETIRGMTHKELHEKEEDKQKRIDRARRDYGYFFEYYFPMYAKSKCGWFHLFIANLLLRLRMVRVLNEWFRGCAKSVHGNMGWPLWLKINGEMRCMALIGATEDKAVLLLSDLQAQLTSNQRFINDFGEQYSYGDWSSGSFTTTDGCHFNAIGIGQNPRGLRKEGNRPDFIVIDDVDSQELSNNPKRVRRLVDWVCDDLMGCFDGPTQRFVVNNNRPFTHSVLGSLIDEKLAGSTETAIRKIQKGVIATGAFLYEVKDFWHRLRVNAVDENMNPSWPEKYTVEYWKGIKADRSHRSWMREYMNTPIVEGTVFKNDWIAWKPALPLNEYDYLICYCDPSWKGTTGSDHKAIILIGKTGNEYHIVRIFNRVASNTTMVKYMYDLYESMDINRFKRPFNFKLTAGCSCEFWIEATLNQDLHLIEFANEGERRGYQLPIRKDMRAKPDKFSRIESLSPFYERQWLFHNSEERESPDMLRHVEHTLAFEQGSKTPDDSLDAEEGAIYYAQRDTRVSKFDPIAGGYSERGVKRW